MKEYVIKVVQETIVRITADTEEEAIQEAYATYQAHEASSVDATVM